MNVDRLSARWIALVLAAAVVLVAACNGEGRVLYEETFEDAGSGWREDDEAAFDRRYRDEQYHIEVHVPDWFVWSRAGERFADVVVETDVQQVSGASDGHYGVFCRFRAPDNFYYFAVTGDGYYAIMRFKRGEPEVLTGEGFLPSSAIRTGGVTQRVGAICDDEHLALYVDGVEVASVTDDALRRGDIGVAVGSGDNGTLRVSFDDLIVRAPGR